MSDVPFGLRARCHARKLICIAAISFVVVGCSDSQDDGALATLEITASPIESASTTDDRVVSSSTIPTQTEVVTTAPAVPTSATTPAGRATTTVAVTTVVTATTPVSTSIATLPTTPGVLEFADFTDIVQGPLLPSVASTLGVSPVRLQDADPSVSEYACVGTDEPWVIMTGGLTLVFEGPSFDDAFVTNWRYVGGPVGHFTELRAPNGISIGDARSDVLVAFPDHSDLGDEIQVSPFLRFGFDDDKVNSIGIVDCVFEQSPED